MADFVVIDKEKLKAHPNSSIWYRRLQNLEDFYTKVAKDDYIVIDKNSKIGQELLDRKLKGEKFE